MVLNQTQKTCLADSAEAANSVFKRMKGLIGRSAEEFIPGKALWIIPTEGIHTFGMRFAIDAAYLDSRGKVLRMYQALPPRRFAAVIFSAASVLELPAGTLARTHTEVGDILEFKAH